MSLDKRILSGKKPLTYFDVEQGNEFIGKECYFSDIAFKYEDLDTIENSDNYISYAKGTLSKFNVYCKEDRVFENRDTGVGYRYCLPCEWVKEPEKKYRPFSIEDWKLKYSFGDTILYRYKGTYCDDHREVETMYLGYAKQLNGITDEAGKGELILGDGCHELQNLFDNYEMWVDGGWKPFGIEVKDSE